MYLGKNGDISRIELKKLIDFLPYPIIVSENTDGESKYLFFNKNFTNKIGYDLSEIEDRDELSRLFYPDEVYREKIIKEWNAKAELVKNNEKGFIKMKAKITCKSGEKKWYEIKASLVNDLNIVTFVNINSDMILQERLKKKNLNNDRMLSILGHDLRSPIANLISISSMGEQSEISQEEFIALMQIIKEESVEVLQLLDTTFNWAKLNFNTIQLKETLIDFKALINDVLKVYKSTYENKGIAVTVDIEKIGSIENDLEILTIIVRNLISNAIKFTSKNGLIAISAEENELIITDSGVGMTEEMVDSILDLNYSTRRGTDNEKGVGIGLQLALSLAEKINCRLVINSEVSKGTSVSILFDSEEN